MVVYSAIMVLFCGKYKSTLFAAWLQFPIMNTAGTEAPVVGVVAEKDVEGCGVVVPPAAVICARIAA
eukprot:m.65530 g.65530  ORF g.65530 m.65530 type:complete len:67 (-) comp19639_c0_seq1:556-756(-)